jgi:hypothetical protein
MAKPSVNARRQPEAEPESGELPAADSHQKAEEAKEEKSQTLKRRQERSHLRARLRNAFLALSPAADGGTMPPPMEAKQSIHAYSETGEAGSVGKVKKDITQDVELEYTDYVKLNEVYRKFIQALATGEALSISADEMPALSISEDARSKLTDVVARLSEHAGRNPALFEAEVAAVEGVRIAAPGEGVMLPASAWTPNRSASDAQLVIQPVPKTWEQATAEHPQLKKWVEAKQPGDTAPEFIKRHYAPWLGKGLTTGDIYRLDRPLCRALENLERRSGLPEGFSLPTKEEQNDKLLAAFKGGTLKVLVSPTDPKAQEKLLRRLSAAQQYRDRAR